MRTKNATKSDKLNLYYNSNYGTLLITKAKTTQTKHAAGHSMNVWRYSNNFIEIYNINQLFNVLDIYIRGTGTWELYSI